MSVSAYKNDAKACLKNRILRAFRITLGIACLAVSGGVAAYYLPQLLGMLTPDPYSLTAAQIALLLLLAAVSGSLRQGRAAWLYCSACGKEPSGLQFRYWLRRGRGFRAALLFLDIRIRKAAWTAMLCAPGASIIAGCFRQDALQSDRIRLIAGIGGVVSLTAGLTIALIIRQKYALAPILFARSPHKGVRSAVRGSCSLMEDDCVRLFRLKLSFLPWAAVCLAVLPLVYVVPYYQQAKACMLRDVLRAHTI